MINKIVIYIVSILYPHPFDTKLLRNFTQGERDRKWLGGLFVLSFVFCVPRIIAETNNEFTVQRPAKGLQGRQKLREEFAELLSEYLELLVEELSLVAKRLSLTDMPCTEREQKKSEVYTRMLYEAQQFLRDGSVVIVQPACCHDEQGDSRALCGFLIDGIAGAQREVIRVLHSMLERDAQCCFVACKTKSQWERYIQRMRRFMQLTAEQNSYLRTIVQNFEKSSC